jgi:hypothetical protein
MRLPKRQSHASIFGWQSYASTPARYVTKHIDIIDKLNASCTFGKLVPPQFGLHFRQSHATTRRQGRWRSHNTLLFKTLNRTQVETRAKSLKDLALFLFSSIHNLG